ncbi:alanine--tRNA ligase [endosymbiont of Euscepes postfasciatus]|uniref:alanine--tRNA ligase-related protein n=1 Tax=endosymbiont of Euscepes postfasciatus TaxID=650377 RepID=UPI000DC6FB00|nr:alanine--tRNA ligase-related protein [endosymbiont of Euscepes postfasciatus]BBA84707.1 alanine--tRNA ligase [endosymbiont of Euscepes postfasciatus]
MNYIKSLDEIRNIFINFFKFNNHILINGSSIIPYNDNSILFTNSGISQFKKKLLGNKKFQNKNVITIQKCLRVGGKHNDLDQIGYSNYHHTFFEMLGNFSFNGYFKKESICLIFELITGSKWFNISRNNLIITVHNIDDESYKIWLSLGINKNNIFKIGSSKNISYSDNFWKMSNYGLCGTSTEILYINDYNLKKSKNLIKDSLEICNIVFIQFNLLRNDKLINLPYKSIDTGIGLERISSVIQQVDSSYKIDVFNKIINEILNLNLFVNINNNYISLKVISDHIRSIIFIINENIYPSNEGRGYILRKIIRRAICYGIFAGINEKFLYKLVEPVINIMFFYKKDFNNIDNIKNIILIEESKFLNILKNGIKILNNKIKKNDNIFLNGDFIFKLHDTYGLPIFFIEKYLKYKNIKFDKKKFIILMKLQRKNSSINNKKFL